MALSHVLSSPIADFTGTVTVFNSAGATTTANATQIVRPSDWNSAHNEFLTLSGNTAGVSTLSGTNIGFQGGNNITLSGTGQTIIISAPNQSVQTQNMVSVGGSTGAVVFSNSNGITFGGNASTITASHNGLTTAALSNHSHGNPTLALTNLTGTTASNSAGLTISLSAAAPSAVTLTNYATGNTVLSSTGTIAGSSIIVAASGGVSAGISNGSYVISGPALTSLSVTGALSASSNGSTISLGVGTVTASVIGNTTQTSTGTINLNALVVSGAGGVSAGISAGSLIISGATGGAGGGAGLSAGTQSVSTGTVAFANSNGITFGMSGSNQITASYNSTQFAGQGTTTAGANISMSMTLNSAGLNVSASVAAPGGGGGIALANTETTYTSGTAQLFAAGGALTIGSTTGQRFNFSVPATSSMVGGANITISTAGNTITIIGATVAGQPVNFSAGTTSGNLGSVVFSNGNGVTFGLNGSTITASHNALTTARASTDAIGLNSALTANGVSMTANSSGLSLNFPAFLTTAQAPGAYLTTARASNDAIGLNTAASNVTWTVNSSGVSINALGYAGTGFTSTTTAGSLIVATQGTNGLSMGVPAFLTVAGGGGGGIALANSQTTYTSGTAHMVVAGGAMTIASTTGQSFNFSVPATSSLVGGAGLSISTNGSTISVYRLAASNMEVYELGNNTAFSTMGQNSIYFQQFTPKHNVEFSNIERRFSGSSVSSTNSQVAAHTYSYGLYSRQTGASSSQYTQIAASSIYFAASFNSNTQAGWTVSQGAASVTNSSAGTVNLSAITGFKHMYFPFAGTVTEGGQYAVAMQMSSATTVGTSPLRIGMMEMTHINNLTIGRIDTAAGFSISNASRIGDFGQGVYSVTSSNLPATLAVSGLTNAVSQARMYLQLD